MITKSVKSVIRNESDFLAVINKCDAVRRVLERATDGVTEDNLQRPLSDALSELNV
jgi:DNA-binding FrmR family transcriptional regulator